VTHPRLERRRGRPVAARVSPRCRSP